MSDHEDSPCDFPHAWIREEVLADIRLDGVSITEATAIGPKIFGEAIVAYAAAVSKHDERLLASDPEATKVYDLPDMTEQILMLTFGLEKQSGTSYRPTLPRTLAVCNGPAFTLALVLRFNRLDVVDVGAA